MERRKKMERKRMGKHRRWRNRKKGKITRKRKKSQQMRKRRRRRQGEYIAEDANERFNQAEHDMVRQPGPKLEDMKEAPEWFKIWKKVQNRRMESFMTKTQLVLELSKDAKAGQH